jgi:hypothetical protein
MNRAAVGAGSLSEADRLAAQRAQTDRVYGRYPVTRYVRNLLGWPVPVRFLPVDFVDGVSVKGELDLLQARVQHYSGVLQTEGMVAENKKLLGA